MKRSRRRVSRLTVTRPQPGVLQRRRQRRQQDAVGGHAPGRAPRRGGPAARTSTGRLVRSSGSPPVTRSLSTPEADEHADQPVDLLEGEQVLLGQPGVLRLGHAVLTPQVAAVGDRQAEVAQRTLQGVEEHARAVLDYGTRAHGAPDLGYDVGRWPCQPHAPALGGRLPRPHDGRHGHREQPGRLEHRLRAAAARRVARLDAHRPDLPVVSRHHGRVDGPGRARARAVAGGAAPRGDRSSAWGCSCPASRIFNPARWRIPGVLVRIGVCYLARVAIWRGAGRARATPAATLRRLAAAARGAPARSTGRCSTLVPPPGGVAGDLSAGRQSRRVARPHAARRPPVEARLGSRGPAEHAAGGRLDAARRDRRPVDADARRPASAAPALVAAGVALIVGRTGLGPGLPDQQVAVDQFLRAVHRRRRGGRARRAAPGARRRAGVAAGRARQRAAGGARAQRAAAVRAVGPGRPGC